ALALLEESAVLECDCHLGREQPEYLGSCHGERVARQVILEIEDADRLVSSHDRHDENGSDVMLRDILILGEAPFASCVAEQENLPRSKHMFEDGGGNGTRRRDPPPS